MRNIVLCIDNDPCRYNTMAQQQDLTCLVTCRLEEVIYYLKHYGDRILGICLDHDMPFQNGMYFAQHVLMAYQHPVVVVTNNTAKGPIMCDVLAEYETPCEYNPASARMGWTGEVLLYFRRIRGV